MSDDLLSPLLAALPYGVPGGTDLRRTAATRLLDWDDDSTRGLVSLDGGDPTWILAVGQAYWPDVVGEQVMVLRNEWTGKAACILGAIGSYPEPMPDPDVLPVRGTVTSVPGGGRVVISAGGQSYTARTVVSYASPSSGDVVALTWASDGSEVIATGEVGAWSPSAPATPSPPSLSRSGGTVTASWSKPSSVDTTRVRWRYPGSSWVTRTGVTGTSTSLPISEGRTREVQIAQSNAGGTSNWSGASSIARPSAPAPSKPGGSGGGGSSGATKYKTVTTTITPTSTGTYRHESTWNRWNGSRYGGFSTLYQGADYGSGTLTGLATYGTKVRDLRAVDILWMEVRLVDANPGIYSPGQPIRVQVSPNGSRPGGAPSTGVASQTASLGKGASKWVRLDFSNAVFNNWADGSIRGLVVNGGPYRGLRGRGTSGMTLRIRYRRRA